MPQLEVLIYLATGKETGILKIRQYALRKLEGGMGKSEACTQDRRVKCATGLGTYMTLADMADDPVFRDGLNDNE